MPDERYVIDVLVFFSLDLGSLGLEATSLLHKYLGDTYKPAVKTPAGEATSTASNSAFFRPTSHPRSGIAVPSDILSEFDRVAALSPLKTGPRRVVFLLSHCRRGGVFSL